MDTTFNAESDDVVRYAFEEATRYTIADDSLEPGVCSCRRIYTCECES
jgi:hypothetical protein